MGMKYCAWIENICEALMLKTGSGAMFSRSPNHILHGLHDNFAVKKDLVLNIQSHTGNIWRIMKKKEKTNKTEKN